MTIVVDEEVTLADIDEALRHIQVLLDDSRLTPRRRINLLGFLDDLLDARLELGGSNGSIKGNSDGIKPVSE